MCTPARPPMENLFFTKLSTIFSPKFSITFFVKFSTNFFPAFIFSHPYVIIFICQNLFLSVGIFFVCDYLRKSFLSISIQEFVFIRFFTNFFNSLFLFSSINFINMHPFLPAFTYSHQYTLIFICMHLFLLVLTLNNFTFIKQQL